MSEQIKYDCNKPFKIEPIEATKKTVNDRNYKRTFHFMYEGKKYRYLYKVTPSTGLGYLYDENDVCIYSPWRTNPNTDLGIYLEYCISQIPLAQMRAIDYKELEQHEKIINTTVTGYGFV